MAGIWAYAQTRGSFVCWRKSVLLAVFLHSLRGAGMGALGLLLGLLAAGADIWPGPKRPVVNPRPRISGPGRAEANMFFKETHM